MDFYFIPWYLIKGFSFKNDYIKDKENETISSYLILIIKFSILIIVCSFFIEIFATILNVYVKSLFLRQLLRMIGFSYFGVLFCLQILLFLYIYIISNTQKKIIDNRIKFKFKVKKFTNGSDGQEK